MKRSLLVFYILISCPWNTITLHAGDGFAFESLPGEIQKTRKEVSVTSHRLPNTLSENELCAQDAKAIDLVCYSLEEMKISLLSLETRRKLSCKNQLKALQKRQYLGALFLIYDYNAAFKKDRLPGCIRSMSPKNKTKKYPRCKRLLKNNRRNFAISESLLFSHAAQLQGRIGEDFTGTRRISFDENLSPEAFAAINFSAFVLDPEYACRRPAVYSFFEKVFSWSSPKASSCEGFNKIFMQAFDGVVYEEIDVNRVFRIDYLLAEQGSSPMSWFGHSMFRLVVCAPDRIDPITGKSLEATPFGEACLKDVDYHLVLNFGALINEIELDQLGGITGKYPSKLGIRSFASVREEYNEIDFRSLKAFPLLLNSQEKTLFVMKMLESYWDYSGRYRFFSNNCASESFLFLAGIKQNQKAQYSFPISPKGVLKEFKALSWLRVPRFSKAGHGYFYPSKKEIFEKIENKIRDYESEFSFERLFRRLDQMSLRERRKFYQSFLLSLKKESSPTLLFKSYRALFLLFERSLKKKMMKEDERKLAQKLKSDLENGDSFPWEAILSPQNLLLSSYGIPNSSEILSLIEKQKEMLKQKSYQDLINKINQMKMENRQSYDFIDETIREIVLIRL